MKSRNYPFFILFLAACFVLSTTVDADARRKKRKKKRKPVAAQVNEVALAELRGVYKFGSSPKQVIKVLAKQIREKYAEKVAATSDVHVQDKLRRKRNKEIKRVKASQVRFKGKRSGWDVSLIDDQYRHKTDESMMVYWENSEGKDQRRFFFFYNDRLYKMFIALNTSNLKGAQRKFVFFQQLVEKRYGGGEVGFRTDSEGIEWPAYVDWRTAKFHARAIDKLEFYNAFCLTIADPRIEAEVEATRADVEPEAKKVNRVIDAVTIKKDDDSTPSLDDGASVIDSILKD